jgi:uncharacterized protein (DUF1330 family)
MPAYVFVNFDVLDPQRQAALVPRFQAALHSVGARIIAFGNVVDRLEGDVEPYAKAAVFEFPTLEAAQAFYRSEIYKPLRVEREKIQRARMFIVAPEA